MSMKAIYKIVALGLCLGLISCSDFLDLQPKNKLGGEQFYQTAEQFTRQRCVLHTSGRRSIWQLVCFFGNSIGQYTQFTFRFRSRSR